MNEAMRAALRQERDLLRLSPDRPTKYRRLAEVADQLGEKPEPGDLPPENAADSTPRERAVPRKAG